MLTWTPPADATGLEALYWVKRPVLYECGADDPCLRYDIVAAVSERLPATTTRYEWAHVLEPGDVLYMRVKAWRGNCESG